MTREEVIALAREAGLEDDFFEEDEGVIWYTTNQTLERFANLVEERTLTNQKARYYQDGVESEREACARVCELMRPSKREYDHRFWDGCTASAAAIRARRNDETA